MRCSFFRKSSNAVLSVAKVVFPRFGQRKAGRQASSRLHTTGRLVGQEQGATFAQLAKKSTTRWMVPPAGAEPNFTGGACKRLVAKHYLVVFKSTKWHGMAWHGPRAYRQKVVAPRVFGE